MILLDNKLERMGKHIKELQAENRLLKRQNSSLKSQLKIFNHFCTCIAKGANLILHNEAKKPGPQGESQKWTLIEEFQLYGMMIMYKKMDWQAKRKLKPQTQHNS